MKKKEKADLKLKTREELLVMAKDIKNDILKAKNDMLSGKLKNTNEVRSKMKKRAVILTFAGQKKGANA